MSLRWKFAASLASLAALAAIAASVIGYASTRSQLYDQIDSSLRSAATGAAQAATEGPPPREHEPDRFDPGHDEGAPRGLFGAEDRIGNRIFVTQRLDGNGRIAESTGVALPVDDVDRALAERPVGPDFGEPLIRIRNGDVGESSFRMATVQLPAGGALQIARSVRDAEHTLSELRDRLLLLTIGIVALAALIGLLLARRATQSLEDLTESAEAVAASGSPEAEISVSGSDEIGRLGRSFSRMLASLAESREQQQRFIQDAGHELRTPLTSITTNLAVLDRLEQLDPAERAKLLGDLRSETGEMSELVNELVELSDGSADEPFQRVDMLEIAERTAARTTRRTGREITVSGAGASIIAQPRALERALGNLLDNADKFDGTGGTIELRVAADGFEVADRGPGIEPGEEAMIFERFHRSIEARNVPGSGLGLSIVEQIAQRHGGAAHARSREGGGAEIGFTVSTAANGVD